MKNSFRSDPIETTGDTDFIMPEEVSPVFENIIQRFMNNLIKAAKSSEWENGIPAVLTSIKEARIIDDGLTFRKKCPDCHSFIATNIEVSIQLLIASMIYLLRRKRAKRKYYTVPSKKEIRSILEDGITFYNETVCPKCGWNGPPSSRDDIH